MKRWSRSWQVIVGSRRGGVGWKMESGSGGREVVEIGTESWEGMGGGYKGMRMLPFDGKGR